MDTAQRLEIPDDHPGIARQRFLSNIAQVDQIAATSDLNYIEEYCNMFSIDPEKCFNLPFEDVMTWVFKWHKDRLYRERYAHYDKTYPEK